MTSQQSNNRTISNRFWWSVTIFLLVLIANLGLIIWKFYFYYHNLRSLPQVYIAGENYGNLTIDQIQALLAQRFPADHAIQFLGPDDSLQWQMTWKELGMVPDYRATAQMAVLWGKQSYLPLIFPGQSQVNLVLQVQLDPDRFSRQIQQMADAIWRPTVAPEIQLTEKKTLQLRPGSQGRWLDQSALQQDLLTQLKSGSWTDQLVLPVQTEDPRLTADQQQAALAQAKLLQGKQIEFSLPDQEQAFVWDEQVLWAVLNLKQPDQPDPKKLMKQAKLLAQAVDKPAENAQFRFDEQVGKVVKFRAEAPGQKLLVEQLVEQVTQLWPSLYQAEESLSLDLPVTATQPEVKLSDINQLGIKQLIAQGESVFKGSIPSRLHNIKVASQKLNGVIIPPGEEFSFNQALGEVSQATGYKPAFIIKNGQTILGDGGGVCQVSTTLFRAALNAGLQITERKPHSYRVSYYEQDAPPGLDATVFAPYADLKFINDTPAHILIQTEYDQAKAYLSFKLYGTADGRTAKVDNFRLWDVTPPPPTLYREDPNLPPGTTKRIEHGIPGAKAAFDWQVMRDGELLREKTFYSNYRAWQEVILYGPGFTPPTPQGQ